VNSRFAPATRLLWHAGVIGALEAFSRAGFQAAEVWAQHLWENDTKPEVVAARARELGMRLSLHAPSYDLNPLSSNPEVRAVSRRQVLESLETATRMGARIVVVHPGQISSSTDNVDDYWAGLTEYAAQLNSRASELGLTVALEAMEKKRLQFVTNIPALQRLGAILEGLPSTVIALDIAHAGTMGDPLEFLERVPRIGHAHLSDTSPEKTHALLGEGKLDLPRIIPVLLERIEATPHGLIAIEGRLSSDEPRAVRVASAYLERF
jgi:sugar phosphate isomerase/epimerase